MRPLWLAVRGGQASTPWHVREEKWRVASRVGRWIWCMKWIVFPASSQEDVTYKIPDS